MSTKLAALSRAIGGPPCDRLGLHRPMPMALPRPRSGGETAANGSPQVGSVQARGLLSLQPYESESLNGGIAMGTAQVETGQGQAEEFVGNLVRGDRPDHRPAHTMGHERAYVREAGAGDPVICIHASASSS